MEYEHNRCKQTDNASVVFRHLPELYSLGFSGNENKKNGISYVHQNHPEL